MSSSGPTSTVPAPSWTFTGLTALSWSLVGITVLISVGRYALRYMAWRKLAWDDLAHLLALITLIAMVASFQTLFPDSYFLTELERGLAAPPTQQQSDELFYRDRQLQYTVTLLFFISTWFVKASFLLFYRSIFEVSRRFMRAWWAVVILVLVTFWICVAGVATECGSAANAYNEAECVSPQHTAYTLQVTEYTCAISVFTDLLIMILPLWMLKDLTMRTPQKFGLCVIFLLGIIIITFDIVRTVMSVNVNVNFSKVAVYDISENCIAVMVCSLPTYRTLFRSSSPLRSAKGTTYQDLNASKSAKSKPSNAGSNNDSVVVKMDRYPSTESRNLSENIYVPRTPYEDV